MGGDVATYVFLLEQTGISYGGHGDELLHCVNTV